MRTDSLFVDPEAMMGMMTAIMEFNAVLGETAEERAAAARPTTLCRRGSRPASTT